MEMESLYSLFKKFPKVSIDSRAVEPGSLYFALRGEQFDGNAFADDALAKGAAYVIIDNPSVQKADFREDERFIVVDDALSALQGLARHHRQHLDIPVFGLTGSNGKTTTKELLRSVLSMGFEVLATKGNLNNHIGVPLTLLQIHAGVEIAIVEMGANHPGEIAFLCELAAPTHGLITNVGKAHLEGFGDFEGVKKTKGELYDYLAGHRGQLFIQGDNPVLVEMAAERFGDLVPRQEQGQGQEQGAVQGAVTYGPGASNQYRGEVVSANPFLEITWQHGSAFHTLQTQLAGAYNLENVLAAVAVGKYFGLSDQQINQGIRDYTPSNNRSQIVDTAKGNRIIGDYYNANASSMAVAIESFRQLTDPRPKILILGDMFELGKSAPEEHRRVIHLALETGAARVLLIGKNFFQQRGQQPEGAGMWADGAGGSGLQPANNYASASFFPTVAEARAALLGSPITDSLLLVKGSRGIALEKLIDLF